MFSAVICSPAYTNETLPNGDISCTNSNSFGSKCTFSCNVGYQLNGHNVHTCNSKNSDDDGDGGWSHSQLPTCQGKLFMYANKRPICIIAFSTLSKHL